MEINSDPNSSADRNASDQFPDEATRTLLRCTLLVSCASGWENGMINLTRRGLPLSKGTPPREGTDAYHQQ
jgi:hypothetical protein